MSTTLAPPFDGIFESPDQQPAAPAAGLNMDTLRLYLAKEQRKKELKAELATIETSLDELGNDITAMLLSVGVDSIKCDGRLIYMANEVFVGPQEQYERADVLAALKAEEDAAMFVSETYNTRSLQSWVKEIADGVREKCIEAKELYDEKKVVEALPASLRRVLKVTFGKSIRTRKA